MPLIQRKPSAKSERMVRFEAHERDYVHAVARKVLKDDEDAADVAQEALFLAYRHRASFRGDSRFTTWLYKVTMTTALMHMRRMRRGRGEMHRLAICADDIELVAEGPTPEEQVAAREVVARAEKILGKMGTRYRAVCRMRFGEGWSEPEIAKELGVALNTVKTRAYRARNAVRGELGSARR